MVRPPHAALGYEDLDHDRVEAIFRETGRLEVRLGTKRKRLLEAMLRNHGKLSRYPELRPAGWEATGDLAANVSLTVRTYLFHRSLYDLFTLVMLHEPRIEWRRTADDAWLVRFHAAPPEAPGEA